jgi:acetyl esterase
MKDTHNVNSVKQQITIEHYSTDPHIGKEIQPFLNAINKPDAKPMETMTPGDARKVLEGAQTSVDVDLTGVEVEERVITEDEMQITLFIVRPADVKETLPVFMFFHGGGWVLGDFPTHQRLLRDLVVHSGMVGVHVEYTRSPEAHFPMALNECYAATKWVATHSKEINVDGLSMAVVGNSVGGNLAAAVAMMAKDRKAPELKLQVLFWPVTDSFFDTESYLRFSKDRFLTRNMMMWFWDNYAKESDRSNILGFSTKGNR